MVTRSVIAVLGAAVVVGMAASSAVGAATPLTYVNSDTRSAGSFQAVASPSTDADGSLEMQTFDNTSNGKVSVVFNDGGQLGTLGDVTSLTADVYKSSASAVSDQSELAFRLWLNPTGTLALVWENQSNSNINVPTDVWQNGLSMASGLFWERGNSANFNGGSQPATLADWASGYSLTTDGEGNSVNSVVLSPTTPIYGVEVAFGSGVGQFTGYVDNVDIGFASGQSFAGNVVATPEPASISLLAIGAAGLLARRRRRSA